MQLEEQAASVAQDEAIFIAAPKRRGARRAILANGLYDENDELAMVSMETLCSKAWGQG